MKKFALALTCSLLATSAFAENVGDHGFAEQDFQIDITTNPMTNAELAEQRGGMVLLTGFDSNFIEVAVSFVPNFVGGVDAIVPDDGTGTRRTITSIGQDEIATANTTDIFELINSDAFDPITGAPTFVQGNTRDNVTLVENTQIDVLIQQFDQIIDLSVGTNDLIDIATNAAIFDTVGF